MTAHIDNRDEIESNSRLIAAAPDLLEACEMLLAHIQIDPPLAMFRDPQDIEIAKKAIAKAKGEE